MNEEQFKEWLKREMPEGTVIGNPEWWAKKIWQAALRAKSVLPNQEPLGSEFEKVLYENLDSLYETDVATQPPTNDKEMINCHYEYIAVDGLEESDAGVWPVLVPNGFKIVNDNQASDERVRELIASDHYASGFQSISQYRNGLLKSIASCREN